VTHVVLVEWAHEIDSAELSRLVATHLPRIAGVRAVDEGRSVSPEGLEGGFDWGMVVSFADETARDGYLEHPEHAVVGAFLREHSRRIVVFDLLESGSGVSR